MTDTKRCARKSKFGCGQLLSLDNFQLRPRKRKDGSIRMEPNSRCRECESLFQQNKGVERRSHENKINPFKPEHYKSILKYYCKLPPVQMSREIRMERRLS